MWPSVVFHVALSAFVIVSCQQPIGDLSEISPYLPSESLDKNLLHQCESFAQNLSIENKRLANEIDALTIKLEALIQRIGEEEEEDDDDEEDENDGNTDSEEHSSRALRSRRAARCDGGTLSAWACAPQCIFKLKGLCGLSLKNICHC